MKQTSVPNLAVVLSGPLPPNPAEVLADAETGRPIMTTEAAKSFEITIVDGPPIMGLADAPIFDVIILRRPCWLSKGLRHVATWCRTG